MIVLFMFVVECTDLTRYFAMKCNCTSMLRPLFATKRLAVSRISCTNISCNVQYGEYPISKYLIWAVPIMVMGSTSNTSSTKRTKISLVHLILNIEKFYTSTYITLHYITGRILSRVYWSPVELRKDWEKKCHRHRADWWDVMCDTLGLT